MTAKSNQTITDAAAPTIVSTTPTSAGVGVSINTDLVIAFSERMDATFDEGTEFAVSPDPGSFTTTWAVDEMTVTLSFANMLCGHTYSVTTDEAEIIASTGTVTTLVTTGPQDGDWTFTTAACGSNSSTPASVSSFSYDGAVCSLENTHSFSVTGSNIDAYLASDNQYFSDAEWVSNDVEGSDSFNVTFDDSADTAYFALRSDTGAVTNVYSFDLTDWSNICNASDDSNDSGSDDSADDNSEDIPSDDSSSDDSSDIVPVAGVNPGDVIHSSTSTAVYYVTSTYTRRVFINEQTYFTWFDSFDGVKEVSASTMSALPLDGSMLPKAGVVLVKIQSSPVVYFLDDSSDEFSPELREIGDEATAIDLFGSNWADYVIDIEPTFFTKFDSGLEVDASEDLGIDVNDMKERESLHD
ncbi:MAG TPA: Ig-like domain-containing protein [bacterium]|nr:Ig-like domain-containing protein [bacterium]